MKLVVSRPVVAETFERAKTESSARVIEPEKIWGFEVKLEPWKGASVAMSWSGSPAEMKYAGKWSRGKGREQITCLRTVIEDWLRIEVWKMGARP